MKASINETTTRPANGAVYTPTSTIGESLLQGILAAMSKNFSNSLRVFFSTLLYSVALLAGGQLFAQNGTTMSPVLSPDVDWSDIFWPDIDMKGNPVTQEESNDEWYYDLIERTQNGVVVGYAVVGYSKDPQLPQLTMQDAQGNDLDCYGYGIEGPTCHFFYHC